MKRYLILAEGRSGDPHYGKTARGVIRYSPHPTVVVVDSERPGTVLEGVPAVTADRIWGTLKLGVDVRLIR